jgi:hypothetical protein
MNKARTVQVTNTDFKRDADGRRCERHSPTSKSVEKRLTFGADGKGSTRSGHTSGNTLVLNKRKTTKQQTA